MMSNKKKIVIISVIVALSFVIIGVVYALFTDVVEIPNKFTLGTVKVQISNLKLTKSNNKETEIIEPADIDTISWTTANVGTSGVLTRHTLEIYWQEEVSEEATDLLYLYPANMSKEAILADFNKGNESEYSIETTKVSKEEDGITKYGIKYQFVSDSLNGSDEEDISNEVNYNSDVEEIIDEEITTDDSSKTSDDIAFRLLLNPNTSYLFEGKSLSIKVTAEAKQYTEDGSANWSVVDTVQIP